ncbi:hypothetical protein C0971_07360 [Bacillus methanolicus]|nr:hypothetical protein C0971_07360 [Bacillus methanolicus]
MTFINIRSILAANGVIEEIMRMIEHGYIPINQSPKSFVTYNNNLTPKSVDIKEVEEVLEAFGG